MIRIPIQKIAISGAAGWLGRELLEGLLEEWGATALSKNVQCFGSFERDLVLSDGTKLKVEKFENNNRLESFDGFVHLAFLTRDKLSVLGQREYISNNLKLTSTALQFIKTARPRWVATVSSGAVLTSPESDSLELNLEDNPYGFLKNVEETMLQSLCSDTGANISIGRLWGAGGKRMPVNRAYALSDFICQALEDNTIRVRAENPVYRRYVAADKFMKLLVLTAISEKQTIFNSGGDEVEIGALARSVAAHFNAGFDRPIFHDNGVSDNYYPRDKQFEFLCNSFGLPTVSLDEIVSQTVAGHKRLFSSS